MKVLIALLAMTTLAFTADEPKEQQQQLPEWTLYGHLTLPLKAFDSQAECQAFAADQENADAAFAHHGMTLDCAKSEDE